MASRARQTAEDIGVTSQLGLFDVLEAKPAESRADRAAPAPSSLAKARSRRRARDGRSALPRLCVKPDEAAQMLSVSRDYFDEHVKPELRIVHRGTRTVLVPVAELVRWVERNATRWSA
jgi:hypothetical protein